MSKPEVEKGSEHWDLVLRPQTSLFQLNLQSIWAYRDLLWLLVRRDFVSFYKQTILGPLWFFIQPLFTTVIYTFIFGGLAKIPIGDVPAPLFYMAGITAWNYFADCITKTSTVFKDNANIFGKVYFPRLIMPLSLVLSNLVRFAVQMILLLLTMAWYYWGRGEHGFHFTVVHSDCDPISSEADSLGKRRVPRVRRRGGDRFDEMVAQDRMESL